MPCKLKTTTPFGTRDCLHPHLLWAKRFVKYCKPTLSRVSAPGFYQRSPSVLPIEPMGLYEHIALQIIVKLV